MLDITNNSIILAPSVLHKAIQKELLTGKKGCIGISIQTIENYLLSLVPHPNNFDTILFQYHQCIKHVLPYISIYKDICDKDYFLQECMQFLDDLKFYKVSIDSLPQDSAEEKEINLILKTLYDIPTRMQYIIRASEQLSPSSKTIYLYPSFLNDKQEILCHRLRKQGAKLITTDPLQTHSDFFHAMNKREEVEAMAQYIIHHDIDAEDVTITICNASYSSLIAQVFQRYHIPYTLLNKTAQNIPAKRYCALLSYYLRPNDESFIALLDHEIFPYASQLELKKYLQLFQAHINDIIKELPDVRGELLNDYELEKLKQLREKAKEAQDIILPVITSLLSLTWQDALIAISDIIVEHLNVNEQHHFIQVQTCIQHAYPYLSSKEDLSFLHDRLRTLTAAEEMPLQGVLIHNLKTLLPRRKHHFIVGAIQSDYPAFPLKKGIFNEAYYAKTPLPDMQTRYHAYMKQLQQQLQQSPHTIISYPLGDYEGKGKEAALEIESFVQKKAIAYPIRYNRILYIPNIAISDKQAKHLYLKDDTLHGSISSFERYQKCPFSYYLRYGLKLKEPFQSTFDESKAGTLAHHILEVLTKTYGKAYVDVQTEKIEEILIDELQAIVSVFPNRGDWANLMKQRLLLNITQNLSILKEMEKHNEMTIFQSEYEFYYNYELEENTTLRLHGFIDRIDQKNEYLRIIDYKSSAKSLQEQQVFAALQLQLITYGIVARHDFQKKLLGTYYISLKNENIPYTAGKMKRRPVSYEPLNDIDYHDAIFTAHRLQGWSMDPHIEIIDDNGQHIKGISMNKNGEVTSRKLYNMNILEAHFQTMYQKIGKRILSGDISIMPQESACQYCKYHEICRFKGFAKKPESLIDFDESIYQ